MNYETFVRTLTSPRCHLSRIKRDEFVEALKAFTKAAEVLDAYKRQLFYGTVKLELPTHNDADGSMFEMIHSDMLHGIIGVATEAGELVERLLLMAENPDDSEHKRNIVEERGDLEFYQAMIDNVLGTNQAEIRTINMQKLHARYDKQFSVRRAIERNLETEQRALGASAYQRGLMNAASSRD